ncbi:uncharacterized protein BX664DRAFT_377380 [Halteromyces radiatus]|uniref:uncharacterized protein n=1 Tax=Halteromyces radiatus TaxID=101107 RepID=UPI00221FC6A4|nr:uncharacterized protein BX664DRAFT_377380 [Halteromyces radiatus]KAI8099529.1 hypothetical protein BX664DRAFT_377380 [Halteromyces radiatus]
MKFALLISSALFAVVSGDVIVSITSPLSGTKLKAGSDAVISWVNPTVPTISQIVLAKGPSTALQPVTTIATNVDTAGGKYVWKIPYEIENGNEYAFELGTSPDLAFAGPFSIEGGVGGTLPSSNATSSAPVSPGAPAASSNPAPAPSAPSAHSSAPSASPSNAKAPAAGSSPTGSSAIQLSSLSGKNMAVVAGAVIILSQLF